MTTVPAWPSDQLWDFWERVKMSVRPPNPISIADLSSLPRRAATVALGLLGVGLILWGGTWAAQKIESYVVARPEFTGSRADVHIARPEWMPEDLYVRAVLSQNGLPERFSAADPDILARLYDSYAGNPWVRVAETRQDGRVVRRPELTVRRAWPNQLTVELSYRRPVALVRQGERYYWIDGEGVLLSDGWEDGQFPAEAGGITVGPRGVPGRWRPLVSDAAGIAGVTLRRVGQENWQITALIIEGVSEPPPVPGQRWAGSAVPAALEMMVWIASRRPGATDLLGVGKELLRRQVRTIVVQREELANFDRYDLRLVTPTGTEIDWGRPPSPEREGHLDPPAERKLERLLELAKERGGLDGKFRRVSLRAVPKRDALHEVRWVFDPPVEHPSRPAPQATPAPVPTSPRSRPPGRAAGAEPSAPAEANPE